MVSNEVSLEASDSGEILYNDLKLRKTNFYGAISNLKGDNQSVRITKAFLAYVVMDSCSFKGMYLEFQFSMIPFCV